MNRFLSIFTLFSLEKVSGVLFKTLVSELRDIIPPEHYLRLLSKNHDFSDKQWVDKVPTPYFYKKLERLVEIFDEYTQDNSLKYSWSLLRDRLFACQMYISVHGILIRPVIPPTKTHQPFSDAKQRIYMSATLGDGGELERITGVEKITRLTVGGWDKQGIGRRFFFFPETHFDKDEAVDVSIEMIKHSDRALVLVPDDTTASNFKKKIQKATDHKLFTASEIEKTKQTFIDTNKAVAVVANRYDGIDLPDDECRLLIVNGIQRATNLQEKFLVTRMPVGILFNDRILTRIVQAVGRCTRSDTDYAAVVILGEALSNKYLLDKDRRPLLHPEIQAELEFGYRQSKESSDKSEYVENLQIFLEHGVDWSGAEDDIISLRNNCKQSNLPGIDKLSNSVGSEVKYQYAIWKRDFERAFQECRSVITALDGQEVQGYRAFWYYLAGSAAYMAAEHGKRTMAASSRDCFKRAASTTSGVTWLCELARLSDEEPSESEIETLRLASVVEGLAIRLTELGTVNDKKFEKEVKEILNNLNKTANSESDSKAFENGHEKLGKLLGYTAGNSDEHAAPDPWWIANDDFCIVFEDHSGDSDGLGATKVKQAAAHPIWIKDKKLLHNNKAEIIVVMVTPCRAINQSSVPFAQDVYYWNQGDFIVWAERAISVIRTLRNQFPGEANLEWRKLAIDAYKDNKLDPASLASICCQKSLSNLPVVG